MHFPGSSVCFNHQFLVHFFIFGILKKAIAPKSLDFKKFLNKSMFQHILSNFNLLGPVISDVPNYTENSSRCAN